MPTLTERLLFACRQCYMMNVDGTVQPTDNTADIGWLAPPVGFVCGPRDIDAGLVGMIPEGVVVAFRGTEPPVPPDSADAVRALVDWLSDFDAILVPDKYGFVGRVHQGFLSARDLLWVAMKPAIAQCVAAAPDKPIYITGHSKGGAVANLAAARLHTEQPAADIRVCTFAAARPGDPDFAAAYGAAIRNSSRYEYQDDFVPHVPPSNSFAALSKHVPQLGDAIAHLNIGFSSVGTLGFIDWSNNIVLDSDLLHVQRFTHLAERFVAFQIKTIAGDHGIAPSSGYAGAPYRDPAQNP